MNCQYCGQSIDMNNVFEENPHAYVHTFSGKPECVPLARPKTQGIPISTSNVQVADTYGSTKWLLATNSSAQPTVDVFYCPCHICQGHRRNCPCKDCCAFRVITDGPKI